MCDRVVGRWSSAPGAQSLGDVSGIVFGGWSHCRGRRELRRFGAQIKCVTAALGFARLEFEGLEDATRDIAHDLGEINDETPLHGPPNAPGREGLPADKSC